MNPLPAAERGLGDPFAAIDADMELLDTVPLNEQPAVFGRIHTALTAALAATAGDPSAGGGGR